MAKVAVTEEFDSRDRTYYKLEKKKEPFPGERPMKQWNPPDISDAS